MILSVIVEAKADIELRWYDGNTLLGTDANTPNTCTYDGTFNVPTPAPRRGYVFTGWQIRPQMDFSTLNTVDNGTEKWVMRLYNSSDNCMHGIGTAEGEVVSCEAYPEFYKELRRNEWKVRFTWGDIYGSSYCSAKSGNNNDATWNNDSSNWKATYSELESASGTKKYCWCQATGYKPNNSDTIYGSSADPFLVFRYAYNSVSDCMGFCVHACTSRFLERANFRRALFGVSQ